MKTPLLIAALALTLFGNAHAQCPLETRPCISVSGEAVVNVKPDKIVIGFGVETNNPDCMVAKKQNNAVIHKALAIVKETGVPDQNVQTDAISVRPVFRSGENRMDYLVGYEVLNMCSVTLADPSQVDGLVTKLLQAGVNRLDDINFQTTEFKKYREQARDLALKAAKEKAEKMAASLGQTIGKPLTISEGGGYGGYYFGGSSRSRNNQAMSQMSQNAMQVIPSEPGGDISDTIALGKIAIRANVQVVFELK